MFSVRVESGFSAAHSLRGYKGKCEELHGHNWKVELIAQGRELDKTGMLIDFHELKSALNRILEKLDHKHLNAIPYFKKANPTSENLAKYIFDKLKLALRVRRQCVLLNVTVWESSNSAATYYEE
jgi:6-pyruvoyltetrahydropterin/6-carboxytetrahydropterin synthase